MTPLVDQINWGAPVMRSTALAYTLPELLGQRFPLRRPLLMRDGAAILREGQIGQVIAERGIGKTWLLDSLALCVASGVSALGLSTPEPRNVLVVDGEMEAQEKLDRLALLCERLGVPRTTERLVIIAADWQPDFLPRVDTREGQAAIEPYVDAADLVILDNRSCLVDPEGEKDATAWQPTQDYLLSLRRRGKAVLVGHHANRQGSSRGHSKSEDVLNLMLKLSRPEGYRTEQGARFVVEFVKARGVHGAAAASFVASLGLDGWCVDAAEDDHDRSADKLREYLTLTSDAGDHPRSANAVIAKAGINRNRGLELWAGLLKRGEIAKHSDGGFYLVTNV